MFVNVAATYVGVADNKAVALGGRQFVKILFHGIFTETVANGKQTHHTPSGMRRGKHQDK
jgi:hypothetical protein